MSAQGNIARTLFVGTTVFLVLHTPASQCATQRDVSPEKVDVELSHLLDNLHDAKNKTYSDQLAESDAVGKANDSLRSYLKQRARDPKLLSVPLKSVSDLGMLIATSPDKKLRLYSWDTQTGGSMRFYSTIAQLHPGNENRCTVIDMSPKEAGDSEFCKTISMVRTGEGKNVYLLQTYSVWSSTFRGSTIEAYSIEHGTLKKFPIFQTTKGSLWEIECSTSDSYDFPDIELKNNNKSLFVPLIDKNGHQTSKYLVYKFNGNKYVFQPGAQRSPH